MDWGLVVGILVFIECLVILRGLMELNHQLNDAKDEMNENMADLSTDLAAALQKVKDDFGIMGGQEQPSAIQSALAQILINSVNPVAPEVAPTIVEAVRGDGGKFLKKD